MTYERQVCRWPVVLDPENEEPTINPDAITYCDVADAAWQDHMNDPNELYCYRDRLDKHGHQITPFYGPTGIGDEQTPGPEETPECLAARATAELVTSVEWPEEDE